MVKRQTVWLSTMMVLSLMVIGYYTLGTPASPNSAPTAAGGGSPSVTTTVANGGAAQTVSGSGAKTTSAGTAATIPAGGQPSDFFVQMAFSQSKDWQQTTERLEGEIANPRLGSAAVARAYSQLTVLQEQQQNVNKVHDMLVGMHYPDSIVLYEPQGRVHVYVESGSLSPEAAVQIINLVAQTLGVQSNLVTVTPHV